MGILSQFDSRLENYMNDTRRFTPCCLILGLTLCSPFAAKSGSINVNGTCETGCSFTAPLSNGESTSGTFDFDYTFLDGDVYNFAGNFSATYSTLDGSTISVDPTVTYEGSSPSAGTDNIDFNLTQDYFDPSCCTWAGTYYETIPLFLASTAGPGSTIAGQVLYDGDSVGLVGPFGPGSYSISESANLDFGALDTDPTLLADFEFEDKFGAGTLPGTIASSTSPTPEPVMVLPCGLALILIYYRLRRRNPSQSN
jgi:hypothetical protein